MQPFIAEKREEIAELCRKHHVRSLAIFGSAVRNDFDHTRSDIDILVEFDEMPIEIYADNKYSLREELSTRFARKVDLLTWKSIKNPYLLQEVESTKEMLYAA